MNVANYNQATATLHGYIFVAGGSFNQTSVERYDPVKDEWMKMASLQYSRQDLDLVEYLGSLYAYEGGLDWATIPRERYNFDRDTWVAYEFLVCLPPDSITSLSFIFIFRVASESRTHQLRLIHRLIECLMTKWLLNVG